MNCKGMINALYRSYGCNHQEVNRTGGTKSALVTLRPSYSHFSNIYRAFTMYLVLLDMPLIVA